MTARFVALCFDANDPTRLARFWAEALRWNVGDNSGQDVALVPTDGTAFTFVFRSVDEAKTAKNPIHLDLTTSSIDDQTDSVELLLALGASQIDVGQGPDDKHVVLADPEGNEFCLIEPTNKFLSGCGRLGSITCDGSPEVGYFWSAALGWPLVWDQQEETAIREIPGTGAYITWGPPIPARGAPNRLHLHIAATERGGRRAEIDRLISLGATRIDSGDDDGDVTMADPDGIEFHILDTR